jgi:hypothetical protein
MLHRRSILNPESVSLGRIVMGTEHLQVPDAVLPTTGDWHNVVNLLLTVARRQVTSSARLAHKRIQIADSHNKYPVGAQASLAHVVLESESVPLVVNSTRVVGPINGPNVIPILGAPVALVLGNALLAQCLTTIGHVRLAVEVF